MCLYKPGVFRLRKEGGYYVGFKQFAHANNKLFGVYWSMDGPRKFDTWLRARGTRKISFNRHDGGYTPGFHIYQRLSDARSDVFADDIVVKVYFDEVIERGYENENKVIVAKYIWIPSDSKKWDRYDDY